MGLAIIASVSAGLGYSLFGPPGVVLWVPLAGLLLCAVRLVARFTPTVAATLPLLLAAIALHSASTLGWGGADAAVGTGVTLGTMQVTVAILLSVATCLAFGAGPGAAALEQSVADRSVIEQPGGYEWKS
jgi:hypothetical protein